MVEVVRGKGGDAKILTNDAEISENFYNSSPIPPSTAHECFSYDTGDAPPAND